MGIFRASDNQRSLLGFLNNSDCSILGSVIGLPFYFLWAPHTL